MTSHDVVGITRKIIGTKKVGHTGTLDPMASGVLPICIGRATKISQYLLNDKKKYRCEMVLGQNTDTQDRWGNVVLTRNVSVSDKDIIKAFDLFKGEIFQTPPMYSALKHKGKKLYELAREGKIIHREPRKIFIYELTIIKIHGHRILFDVLCSKGTYVRSLCEDIGNTLDCGAHMSFLLRTQSGRFHLTGAVSLEDLKEGTLETILSNYLYPMDYPLEHMPKVNIKKDSEKYLLNGNDLYLKNMDDYDVLHQEDMVRLYVDNQFMALGKVKERERLYIDIDTVF